MVAWLALVAAIAAAGALVWPALHRDQPKPPAKPALHAVPATFERVLAKAVGGDTILLGPGNYGSFAGAVKPSAVTIRPEAGASARMALAFSAAANLRIEGLTIDGADIGGSTHDVRIARSTFTHQVVIHADRMRDAGVVLDGNRLARIDVCADCYEGRVHVLGDSGGPSGIVISHNVLGPGGDSDGIQVSANGVRILDNTFVGIQGSGGRHIDALQLYGASNTVIRGNYFRDVASAIMSPDGGDHERIERNVFDTGGYPYAIMLGGDDGSVIRHNTLADLGGCAYDLPCGTLLIDDGPRHRPGKGTVVEDNILGALSVAGASTLGGSRGNLVAAGGGGAADSAGRPAFVAGPHPTSREGFRLADGSPGVKAASDGANVGFAGG
jgi:parallel beta helix pectate lyase-like protein